MAQFKITINSVLGGWAPSQNIGLESQFDSSLGIDPDMPVTDSSTRTSGIIRPTATTKFSGGNITDAPLWFLTNPKDSLVYAYMKDGKIVSYSNTLASETLVGTPTSGAGNGAAYYDNYLYFTTPTDVARYGPLNGSPSLTNSYWTSSLSKTALVNTTYPTINGIQMPNHVMYYHPANNTLYFADVISGKGTIHYIATTKTSVEGDTDNGSTYAKLTTTPYGYLPTSMAHYGTDLVIGCVQGTDSSLIQKKAVILFWDTVSTAPSKSIAVELPDPYVTALLNVNGVLYAWLGNAQGGTRVVRFAGGYSWDEVAFIEDAYPPFQGAVDHWMNKVVWGSNSIYPEASACVWSVGSKNKVLGNGNPLHNILRTTSTGSTPLATALKYVQQSSNIIRQPIVGWKDASAQGIDKVTTGLNSNSPNVFRSQVFKIGKPFQLMRMRICLTNAIASGVTITPTFYTDELSSNVAATTINNTNYPGNKNIVQRLSNSSTMIKGQHSFILELRWTGSTLAGVTLPIVIEGELLKDQNE